MSDGLAELVFFASLMGQRCPPRVRSQPATAVCKMGALSEYVHVAYMFFCTFGVDLYDQSVRTKKNSASELSRKFIKSALLVGMLWAPKKKAGGRGRDLLRRRGRNLSLPPPQSFLHLPTKEEDERDHQLFFFF